MCLYVGYGINLVIQMWDKEGVYYGVGGYFEINWCVCWEGDFVDGGDILFWIDEELFLVYGNYFDGDWFFVMCQWFVWFKCVCGFSGQYGKENDD